MEKNKEEQSEAFRCTSILNKTCDPCRARKVKCDGVVPECSECSARKKKRSRGKTYECVYSIRKKADRRPKSDGTPPKRIEDEDGKQTSESPNLLINSSYLKCCVETLAHLFPIVNEEISEAAFDINSSVEVWACLAIGAFLEGDVQEAKHMYANACSMELKCGNSLPKISFIRSQLLVCLFLKMTGDVNGAAHFLKMAERESGNVFELQAIVAAFKLSFMPLDSSTAGESAFNFQMEMMQNFTFDSKIYFYYRSILQKHSVSGLLKALSQAEVRECYQLFLLAEAHTHTSGLILKSPHNWIRLQPFLMLLELFQLGMPMEALKRARRLTLFLLQNQEYFQKFHKLVDVTPLLSIVSTYFKEIQDVTFLEMVTQIRASLDLSIELANPHQGGDSEIDFCQLLKLIAGRVEEDALDMKKMMTEPILDEY